MIPETVGQTISEIPGSNLSRNGGSDVSEIFTKVIVPKIVDDVETII
jgi:hypothetical protein